MTYNDRSRLWLEMTKLAYSKEASFGEDITSSHMRVFMDNIRKDKLDRANC